MLTFHVNIYLLREWQVLSGPNVLLCDKMALEYHFYDSGVHANTEYNHMTYDDGGVYTDTWYNHTIRSDDGVYIDTEYNHMT